MGQEYSRLYSTDEYMRPRNTQQKGFIRQAGCFGCFGCLGIISTLIIIAGILFATSAGWIALPQIFVFTPNSSAVYFQVQKMNRLETVSYKIESVYKYDQNANSSWYDIWKYISNQKKLFVIPGEAIAGVDLSQLKPQDVQIHDKAITMTLPASQILETSLDEQHIQVYDISTGAATLFQGMDPNTQDQVLTAAKASFKNDACKEGDILKKAAENAKQQFIPLLTELGFTSVTVNAPSGTC